MRRLSGGEKEWNLRASKRRRVPPTRNTPIAEAAVWRELLFKERAKEKSLEDEKTGGGGEKTTYLRKSAEPESTQPDLSPSAETESDTDELNDLDCAPAERDSSCTSNSLHHQNIVSTAAPKNIRPLSEEMANRQQHSETANDATLARLLQGDEYGQEGPPPSPPALQPGMGGHGCAPQQSSDYELARQVQEEMDAEVAMQLQGDHAPWQGHTHHHHSSGVGVGGAGRMRSHPYTHTSSATVPPRQVQGRGAILPPPALPPRHLPAHRPQAHHNFRVEQEAAQHIDMSYEGLLELEDVKCGVDRNTLNSITSTHTYSERPGASEESRTCAVCKTLYSNGEELRLLPCLHTFHRSCVDPWLESHTQCPVCMKDIKEHPHIT